jgi:hypothetical protein
MAGIFSALSVVAALLTEAGANAAAELRRDTMIASFMVKVGCNELQLIVPCSWFGRQGVLLVEERDPKDRSLGF